MACVIFDKPTESQIYSFLRSPLRQCTRDKIPYPVTDHSPVLFNRMPWETALRQSMFHSGGQIPDRVNQSPVQIENDNNLFHKYRLSPAGQYDSRQNGGATENGYRSQPLSKNDRRGDQGKHRVEIDIVG